MQVKAGPEEASYYAVESNPKTRTMYSRFAIPAAPYAEFIKKSARPQLPDQPVFAQCSLFG